jgi:hypothetical protein
MPNFTPAPPQQPGTGLWPHGPEHSKTDRRRHNLRADTASTISVDHAGALGNKLPQPDTMVLGLGTGHGTCSFAFTDGNQAPVTLEHRDGQIDIDSVCTGVRDARNHVIVTCGAGRPAPSKRPSAWTGRNPDTALSGFVVILGQEGPWISFQQAQARPLRQHPQAQALLRRLGGSHQHPGRHPAHRRLPASD